MKYFQPQINFQENTNTNDSQKNNFINNYTIYCKYANLAYFHPVIFQWVTGTQLPVSIHIPANATTVSSIPKWPLHDSKNSQESSIQEPSIFSRMGGGESKTAGESTPGWLQFDTPVGATWSPEHELWWTSVSSQYEIISSIGDALSSCYSLLDAS